MPADYPRDRYGRPLVADPDNLTEVVTHDRPSSYGQVLDDRYALNQWRARMAVTGASSRKDLLAQIAATSIEGGKGSSRVLDSLVEECIEAAGGSEGRRLGDALHSYVKMVNSGLNPVVLEPWDADVDAYKAALLEHGLRVVPELVEVAIANDLFKCSGSADLFLEVLWDRDDLKAGDVLGADLKTGKTPPSSHQYGVQLYLYITGQLYNLDTGERSSIHPRLRTDVGLMIHLPAGKAVCNFIRVDLAKAGEYAELARIVRAATKDMSYITRLAAPAPAPPAKAASVPNDRLVAKLAVIVMADNGKQVLAELWTEAELPFPPKQLATVELDDELAARVWNVLSKAEDMLSIPFGAIDLPPEETKPKKRTTSVKKATSSMNEGGPADPDAVALIAAWLKDEDADIKGTVKRLATEASRAGKSISLAVNPSVRRFEIARAIQTLAEFSTTGVEVEQALNALSDHLGTPEADTTGARLGALDVTGAQHLAVAATQLAEGHFIVGFDDQMHMTVRLPQQPTRTRKKA